MKTEKMSFKNIKDVLSRDEMKSIMAGSLSNCGLCFYNGGFSSPCVTGGNIGCTCMSWPGAGCQKS